MWEAGVPVELTANGDEGAEFCRRIRSGHRSQVHNRLSVCNFITVLDEAAAAAVHGNMKLCPPAPADGKNKTQTHACLIYLVLPAVG